MLEKNIYARFVNDSYKNIKEFEYSIQKDEILIKKLIAKERFGDEIKLAESRIAIAKDEIKKLYSARYSFHIACILKNGQDPCKEAKENGFISNNEYAVYLESYMTENGFVYNQNIIDDIRNTYMKANIEKKDFSSEYGMGISMENLFEEKRPKNRRRLN